MRPRDEAKERAILAGTLAVVERRGLAGLSMEAVAKAAKIAIGTVYIYFKNKEALLNALYATTKREFARHVLEGGPPGEPVKLAFKRMCVAYLRYIAAHQAEVLFMNHFRNSPFIFEKTKEKVNESAAPLVALLERGKVEGLLKEIETPLMIAFLQGTLSELAAYAASERAQDRERRYGEISQICWDGLKA